MPLPCPLSVSPKGREVCGAPPEGRGGSRGEGDSRIAPTGWWAREACLLEGEGGGGVFYEADEGAGVDAEEDDGGEEAEEGAAQG